MIQLNRLFYLLMVTLASALAVSCTAPPVEKYTEIHVDSAKVKFYYVKTDTSHYNNKKSGRDYYILSVVMDMDLENNQFSFEHESFNAVSPRSGWRYQFFQEQDCQEYTYNYLCIPSIKLALPISEFQSKTTWQHGLFQYTNKGMQSVSNLSHYGPVFVISASQLSDSKLRYTYYLTLNKGLVAFVTVDSKDLWVLSEKNEFGVGALSMGKSINANTLSTSDIKHYEIVKGVDYVPLK